MEFNIDEVVIGDALAEHIAGLMAKQQEAFDVIEPKPESKWWNLPGWIQTNLPFKRDLTKDEKEKPLEPSNPDEANLVSSKAYVKDGVQYHYPCLDIDMSAALVKSTTPGHNHLYINKALTNEEYDELLRVLVKVGIVQKGIYELQWEKSGATFLRLPGLPKAQNELSSGGQITDLDPVKTKTFLDQVITTTTLTNKVTEAIQKATVEMKKLEDVASPPEM